jgi:hypothetical protein
LCSKGLCTDEVLHSSCSLCRRWCWTFLSRRSGWAIAHAIATSPAFSTYMSVICPDCFLIGDDGYILMNMVIVGQGCSGQTMSHNQKANIVQDMLRGLQHLHSRDIVHSSLRPLALVVHFDSEQAPTHTQILDLAGAAVLLTLSTAVKGPLAYMPPAKLLGLHEPSTAGDIRMAGWVAASAFLGKHMFDEPHLPTDAECKANQAVELFVRFWALRRQRRSRFFAGCHAGRKYTRLQKMDACFGRVWMRGSARASIILCFLCWPSR